MANDNNQKLIAAAREFLKFDFKSAVRPSDQMRKLPQPPLAKPAVSETRIALPKDHRNLELNNDILSLIFHRESHRVYTQGVMSLGQLAFLLWATQGVKAIRGQRYATLRTVPSGGARHPFETYLYVNDVEGLTPGRYHYLPLTHELEFLGTLDNAKPKISSSLLGQDWATNANVLFYWSVIPYRGEWRYTNCAHRIMLVDIGHVCQNLYIACEALGLGTCAIGAFSRDECDRLFALDGEEEFTLLAAPVGTISPLDKDKEQDFYAFLKEEAGNK